MRLGVIATIIFIALSLGIFYGPVTNEPLIDSNTQTALETQMNVLKVTQEGDWGPDNFITLVTMPFTYFDSLVGMAWDTFNNPLWTSDGWVFVPYFTLSPFVAVLVFGLIILLIGITVKTI